MPHQVWIAVAAASGLSAVALGAFGAHALRDRLDDSARAVWQTASLYQLFHTLALLAVALLLARADARWLQASAWCFAVGTLLFSGSLYALAVTGIRPLGAITPIGGVALLAAWAALLIWALRA